MVVHKLELPDIVRLRAISLGEQGRQWIASLDDAVEHLESAWSLQIGEVLPGGSESLVVGVVCEDGIDAVLKIGLSGSADLAMEANVYRLAEGRGYQQDWC